MSEEAVIRYESRSVTNGKPVGSVYVARVPWGTGIYSYTKDPAEATRWDSVGIAEQIIRQHTWQEARAIPVKEAKAL
jgi:hypothetical protein